MSQKPIATSGALKFPVFCTRTPVIHGAAIPARFAAVFCIPATRAEADAGVNVWVRAQYFAVAKPSPLSENTARKRVTVIEFEKAPKISLKASAKPTMVNAFRTVIALRPRAMSRSAAQPDKIAIVASPPKDMNVNQPDAVNERPNRSLK